MEKIIKTLPELKSIIDANKFHTFDYTEGFSVSDGIEIFEIDIEETNDYQGASATLCIYPNEDILFNDIQSNILSMDLEEGTQLTPYIIILIARIIFISYICNREIKI